MSSWKMFKKTIKLCRGVYLQKNNKNIQRKPSWNVLYTHGYDVTYVEFKILHEALAPQNKKNML